MNKNYFAPVLISILFALLIANNITGTHLSHDLTAYLAPVVAYIKGYGIPYLDFFDIKAPGLLIFFLPWVYFFGYSLVSMLILELIVTIICMCLYRHLIKELSNRWVADIFFVLSLFYCITSTQLHMMLQSETIGLLMVLSSIVLVAHCGLKAYSYLIAGFLLLFAGQVKEIYIFTPAAMMIYIAFRKMPLASKVNKILFIFIGCGVSAVLIFLFLKISGAYDAYIEVIQYKRTFFSFPPPVSIISKSREVMTALSINFYPYFIGIGLLVVLVALNLNGMRLNKCTRSRRIEVFNLVWLQCLVILVGFIWQMKRPDGHYLLPIWIMWSLFSLGLVFCAVHIIQNNMNIFMRFLVSISAIIVIYPLINNVPDAIKFIANEKIVIFENWPFENDGEMQKYDFVKKQVLNQGCIQQAYGWNSGAAYIYTNIKPCSKYFLSNLIKTSDMKADYKSQIIKNLPAVIIYSTYGADMDTKIFEKEVISWHDIINKCYQITEYEDIFILDKSKKDACLMDFLVHENGK